MVDKPVPKKPIHPVDAVSKAGDLTAKLGEPIAQKTGDNWVISVYYHPVVRSRFSYSLIMNGRPRLNPSPIDDDLPYLFGCFSTPVEALAAGEEEFDF